MLEVVHPAKFGSELLLECGPGDELWLTMWHPVQPLCEPSVDVQSRGRMRQPCESTLIQRHGVVLEAGEVFVAQADRRGPQDPLLFILGEPQVEGCDDL